jgi:hypothetical protein
VRVESVHGGSRMAALLTGETAVQAPGHHDSDLAAWTLRRGSRVINWRDTGLEDDPLIAPWAVRALDGCCYADLLYGELRALHIVSN